MLVTTRSLERRSEPEPSPPIPPEIQRRLSVEEFHRMLDAGIFDDDERVELLDGILVAMTRQGPPHALVIQRLDRALQRQLGDDHAVRVQLPLTLPDRSEPIPDLAVVRAADTESKEHHPRTALVVIEVADTTLHKDRLLKAVLYARAGIPEYWIVNVNENCVEVYRGPDSGAERYRTLVTLAGDDTLTAAGLPGLKVPVAEILV
jgi:Uma2 family endonuclease